VLGDDYLPSYPGVGASANPHHGAAAEADKKMKRYVLIEEDVGHTNFITEAVKAVAQAITNASPPDVHHALYAAVMDASSTFSVEAEMVVMWALPFGHSTLPYLVWQNRGPSGALQSKEVQDVGCTVIRWKVANS
jgi:hypothetical protein